MIQPHPSFKAKLKPLIFIVTHNGPLPSSPLASLPSSLTILLTILYVPPIHYSLLLLNMPSKLFLQDLSTQRIFCPQTSLEMVFLAIAFKLNLQPPSHTYTRIYTFLSSFPGLFSTYRYHCLTQVLFTYLSRILSNLLSRTKVP